MTRRTALVSLVIAVACGSSACTPPWSDDTAPPPSSSSPADTLDIERAGRQLSEDEARAVVGDGPPGWDSEAATPPPLWRKTDPHRCADVLRIGRASHRLKPAERVRTTTTWSTNPDPGAPVTIGLDLRSHDRPVGPDLLDDAGAALGECEGFALTAQGTDIRVGAIGLAFANLGEQTFAVRLTTWDKVNGRSTAFYVSYVSVRVGHNLLVGSHVSTDEDADLSVLEAQMRAALQRLES